MLAGCGVHVLAYAQDLVLAECGVRWKPIKQSVLLCGVFHQWSGTYRVVVLTDSNAKGLCSTCSIVSLPRVINKSC